MVARASDGTVWSSWQPRPGDAEWHWLNLGGEVVSPPAIVVDDDGVLWMAGVDPSGSIIVLRLVNEDEVPARSWFRIGGKKLEGEPALVADGNGRPQVFVRGSDRALWTRLLPSAAG